MTWKAVLKSNIKDAVFGRHLALFKKRINNLANNPNYPLDRRVYIKRVTDMVLPMVDELVASNDKERQEEILNDLYYGEVGEKIRQLHDKTGVMAFRTFRANLRSFVADHFPNAKNDTVNKVISIDGTFNKSFKDTVFDYDRDISRLKKDLKDIRKKITYLANTLTDDVNNHNLEHRDRYTRLKRIRNEYMGFFYHGGKRKEEPEEWIGRFKDSQEEVINDVESIATEILQENDKKKKEELANSLLSDSITQRMDKDILASYSLAINRFLRNFTGRPEEYNGLVPKLRKRHYIIREEYLLSQGYKKEYISKSFKETVFNNDSDVLKFKKALQSIRDDTNKFYNEYKDKPEVAKEKFPNIFWVYDSLEEANRQVNIGLNTVEDYLKKVLYETDENEKELWLQGFTSDYVMEKLARYKNRYIQALAIFMYNKFNATIQPSKLNEMGIFTRVGIP